MTRKPAKAKPASAAKPKPAASRAKPVAKPAAKPKAAKAKPKAATAKPAAKAATRTQAQVPPAANPIDDRRVKLDTSRMKSSYCNVCNATSTREEVVVNFGLNQSWDRPDGDLEIEIQHRIIMSPHAARKLKSVLDELIAEYETRYGPLEA